MKIEASPRAIKLDLGNLKSRSCFLRWFVLLSLPLLILLGVIAGYLGVVPFSVHTHSVVMISIIFIIYFIFLKHNAYYATCKFSKNLDDLEDAMGDYINKNRLKLANKTKSNAPFDAFMQSYTSSLRNDNFASVATGVFPTLGILGTFISIALTMPSFSSTDAIGMEREISKLLGGVGTAFYVSIYGIFLSLWWLFFEKSGMSQFEKDVAKIKRRVKNLFWSKEEIEQIHFVKSMENFEHLNQVFEKITANEFIQNLENILQQRVDLFESVIHHEQNMLKQTTSYFNELTKDSELQMQKSREFLDRYNDLTLSMNHIVNRMDDSSQALRQIVEKLTHKESDLAHSQANLLQDIKSHRLDLDQTLQALKNEGEKILRRANEPRIIDNR